MKYLIVLSFWVSHFSYAEILLEPIIGYSLFPSGEYTGQGEAKYSFSALTFAARFGYSHPLGISGGFYSGTTLGGTFSRDDNTVDFDYDASRNDLGPFIAYENPAFPVRGYFQYFMVSGLEVFDEEATSIAGINYNARKFRGNGIGVGAGFTGLSFGVVNLEYRRYSYDESEQNEVTDSSRDLSLSELFLSFSMPFKF